MDFIAGHLNGKYISSYHKNGIKMAESVKAAVAYASGDPPLIEDCWKNNIKLEFWCRYDFSVPVSTNILNKFLKRKSPNFVCKLVQDIFHPKVIWWVGYGAYIGSANLNINSWYGNIESGVFMSEVELISNDFERELDNFFDEINKYSNPLTQELYDELISLKGQNKVIESLKQRFTDKRQLKILKPLTYQDEKSNEQKRYYAFLKEWNDTLQTLRGIGDRVSNRSYRPSWVSPEVPKGIHADRFLNSYYYTHVKPGNKSKHEDLYLKNQNDPEKALVNAMNWWHSLKEPTGNEDIALHEHSPFMIKKLSEDRILHLSDDEFVEVCEKINAIRDHGSKYTDTTYQSKTNIEEDQRISDFAKSLYNSKSNSGHSILETINYLLYGGSSEKIPERIWEVVNLDKWRIPHLGISSVGELVGWAMPNKFPPRNERTSKALRALGYNVKISV